MALLRDIRCNTSRWCSIVYLFQACYLLAWVRVLTQATEVGTTDPPEHLTLFVTLPMPSDDPLDTITTTPASSNRPRSFSNITMAMRTTAKGHEEDRAALLLPSPNDFQVDGRSGSSSLVYPFPRRTPRPRPTNLARPISTGALVKENYYASTKNARPWFLQRPHHNMTRVLGV
ncbi:uncharacterized protein LOC123516651 [Portunus trituberculatus]|uniref:uncharacterized protein LOC123516651 n=1 Tax=Portunus trituberculatus TaxID=210409 RepID=UPI001E1CBF1A|nr:uncharacterized protein LOC123516651 [Portunus trituberculatus]